jgi:energy-coupling factor transport system substrate-specific component
MDYVRSGAGTQDVGALERTILVVRAAGQSARSFGGRDLIAALESRFRSDGSISDQVNLTAFAILALRSAGVTPGPRTYAWLAGQQGGDGGFGYAGAASGTDPDDTGAALEALARPGGRAARARRRAVAYLRRVQDRDGGFPSQAGGVSNAQSTAWAIQGLEAVGVDPGSLRRSPLGYLRSLVSPGGRVSYARGVVQTPVWVTGEALMALEGKPLPVAAPPAPPVAASSGRGPAPARRGSPRVRLHPRTPPRRKAAAHRARRIPVRVGKSAAISGQFADAVGVVTAVALAPVGLG